MYIHVHVHVCTCMCMKLYTTIFAEATCMRFPGGSFFLSWITYVHVRTHKHSLFKNSFSKSVSALFAGHSLVSSMLSPHEAIVIC